MMTAHSLASASCGPTALDGPTPGCAGEVGEDERRVRELREAAVAALDRAVEGLALEGAEEDGRRRVRERLVLDGAAQAR